MGTEVFLAPTGLQGGSWILQGYIKPWLGPCPHPHPSCPSSPASRPSLRRRGLHGPGRGPPSV
jgi:hypothetical protein